MRTRRKRRPSIALLWICAICITSHALAGELSALQSSIAAPLPQAGKHPLQTEKELRDLLDIAEVQYRDFKRVRDFGMGPRDKITDKFGATVREYLQRTVLTSNACERVESLLSTARAALRTHDRPSAQAGLDELQALLTSEADRYNAIMLYWRTQVSHPPDLAPYREYLRRIGIEPRYGAEIAALHAQFDMQLMAMDFLTAMMDTYPKMQAQWRKAAKEEAAYVEAALTRPDFSAFLAKQKTNRCSRTPPSAKPSASPSLTSIGIAKFRDYYPPEAKLAGEEGRVYLFVQVSAQGCPVRAVVTGSSGYPRLDGAALQFAVDVSYAPAVVDGMPVEKGLSYKVDYQLRDEAVE